MTSSTKLWKGKEHLRWLKVDFTRYKVAQSAVTVEYTDYTSAKGYNPANKCPGYDTKQSDGEVPVMLGLWGMWSTLSLLPGSLWPGRVAPDKDLSIGQIELNCTYANLNCLK